MENELDKTMENESEAGFMPHLGLCRGLGFEHRFGEATWHSKNIWGPSCNYIHVLVVSISASGLNPSLKFLDP